MSDCYAMSYNGKQARLDGKEMTPVDLLIERFSDPLLHTEFWFSNRYHKASFSSTMRGSKKGCRFKGISYSHPNRWTALLLPMTDEQEDRAYRKAEDINGLPYDLIGVSCRATGIGIIKPNPNAYWCNEAVGELTKAGYEYGEDFMPDTMLPNDYFFEMYRRLSRRLNKMDFEAKELLK